MSEILSKSAYARRCGRTPASVSQWIKRGQLTPPAVRRDGKINVALADQQLAMTVDLSRGRTPSRIAELDD